jgi:hypothetical protein
MKIKGAHVREALTVAALLAGTAWLGQQVHHNYVTHPGALARAGVAVAPMTVPATTTTGAAADLSVRAVPQARVLFVVSTDCPFCEQNMPEWLRLAASLREMGSAPRPVVLSVSSAEETEAYLARHGLDADVRLVDSAVLPLLGVTGYPSTVAIDPGTGAISSWTGVLSEGDHQALLAWSESRRQVAAP